MIAPIKKNQDGCKIKNDNEFKKMLFHDPLFKKQIERIFSFFMINYKLYKRIPQNVEPESYESFEKFMQDKKYMEFIYNAVSSVNIPKMLNQRLKLKKQNYKINYSDFSLNNRTSRFEVNGFILDVQKRISDLISQSEKLIDINLNSGKGVTKIKIKNQDKQLILKYKIIEPQTNLYKIPLIMSVLKNKKLNKSQMKKLSSIFYDAHQEDFNEVFISSIINLMNFICPLFPYFYFASLSNVVVKNVELPCVISVQEDVGKDIVEEIYKFSKKDDEESVAMRELFYSSMLEQLTFGLYLAQKSFNFVHFDLHPGNVLFEKIDKNQNLYYKYSKTHSSIYEIQTNGFLFHIIDFGRSYVKTENNEYYDEEVMQMTGRMISYQSDLLFICRRITFSADKKLASILENPQYSNLKFVKYFRAILGCQGNDELAYPSRYCLNNKMENCKWTHGDSFYQKTYLMGNQCKQSLPSQLISNEMHIIKVDKAKENRYVIPLDGLCQ